MNSKLKSALSSVGVFGGCLLYLIVAVGILVAFFAALDYLAAAATILAALSLLAAVPLLLVAFVRRARRFSGNGLIVISYALGVSTWLTATVYLKELWGATAVVVGIFMMGIGSVPLGFLALIFHGEFRTAFMIVGQLILVYLVRILGIWIESKGTKKPSYIGEDAQIAYSSDFSAIPEAVSSQSLTDDAITVADISAIRDFARYKAEEWWKTEDREVAACDTCNSSMRRNAGFLIDDYLLCELCFDPESNPNETLENLCSDPDYYGESVLREARVFVQTREVRRIARIVGRPEPNDRSKPM